MFIQPNYALVYASAPGSGYAVQRKPAAESPPPSEKVSISQPAYLLSRSSAKGAQAQDLGRFSAMAHANPKVAEHLAMDYAFDFDFPMVDLSHDDLMAGKSGIYTVTGESVTEESEAWFNNEAARIRQERIALYQSEKAKGTPDADIFDKIIRFMDAQPERYLQLLNWKMITGRV